MVLPIIIVIAALLGVSVIGGLMGWLIPAVTALLLFGFAWLFISKSIEAMGVADSIIFPALYSVLGIGSALFGLFLVNPGVFQQSIPFSITAQGAVPVVSSVSLLSAVPAGELVGSLSVNVQAFLVILGIAGAILLVKKYKEGK